MSTSDIQKHQTFTTEVKDYIKECLENKTNPATILDSFAKLIDETVIEVLKEKSK